VIGTIDAAVLSIHAIGRGYARDTSVFAKGAKSDRGGARHRAGRPRGARAVGDPLRVDVAGLGLGESCIAQRCCTSVWRRDWISTERTL
jgi:hypothetical protein